MLNDETLLDFRLDCYKNLIKYREQEEFKKALAENRKRMWEEQCRAGFIYTPYISVTVTPVSEYSVDLSNYINKKVDKSRYAKIVIGDSLLA